MCLITFAWKKHPLYKLILAANRDEFYDRPTAPLSYWHDHPGIIGGRDLKEGGTWMGIRRNGRFAAITNYRDLSNIKMAAPSRGKLTTDFLRGQQDSRQYFDAVKGQLKDYNGFNLLTLESDKMFYFNNIQGELTEIQPGIYGLSNAFIDTPWPKVVRAKNFFSTSVAKEHIQTDEMMQWMSDSEIAPDDQLPSTGVPLDLERKLSAMCISTENYGTGCTSVLTISYAGEVTFSEKTYPRGNRQAGLVSVNFQL